MKGKKNTFQDFLATTSHEIKTPITLLLLQLQTLIRKIEYSKDSDENIRRKTVSDLKKIEKQTKHLSNIVRSLLDITTLREGKFKITKEYIELTSIAKRIVRRFQRQFQKTGVSLTLEFKEKIYGNWDKIRVEQIFNNLISNSLKYGQGKPVVVKIFKQTDFVCIKVIDQGIGINQKDLGAIFKKFRRAAPKDVTGTGIGLYVTHQIVSEHKGTITVESTPGHGSTFTVKLPF